MSLPLFTMPTQRSIREKGNRMSLVIIEGTAWQARLEALRVAELVQTQEKQAVIGAMDHNDWALILPPPRAVSWCAP